MGILADSLRDLITQMKEQDERLLKRTYQQLDDLKLNIEAMRKLDQEIDSIDKITS